MKCLVLGCLNTSDQGEFVGDLCEPCHSMLATGRVHHANKTFIGDLQRTRVTARRLTMLNDAEVNVSVANNPNHVALGIYGAGKAEMTPDQAMELADTLVAFATVVSPQESKVEED